MVLVSLFVNFHGNQTGGGRFGEEATYSYSICHLGYPVKDNELIEQDN